jgi:putative membrane protein
MFFESILAIIIGIACGIFTGLIPGIHANLVAIIVLVLSPVLPFSPFQIIILLISLGITQSFFDFIPSLVLGIPDESTAIHLLPNQHMVLQGRAYEALYLNGYGSFMGIVFGLLFTFFLYFFLPQLFPYLKKTTPFVLLLIIFGLIFLEQGFFKKIWASIVVLFAGFIGEFTLHSYHVQQGFLLLFTGLFAIPAIILSLFSNQTLPKQYITKPQLSVKTILLPLWFATLISFICSVTPGIGTAQATTGISLFFKKITTDLQIFLLSSINTMVFLFSITTLYLLSKSRNGIISVVQHLLTLTLTQYLFLLFLCISIGYIAMHFSISIGKKMILFYQHLNLHYVNSGLLFFLLGICFYFSSWFGLLIVLYCSILGILTIQLELKRSHLMSVLLLPILLFML